MEASLRVVLLLVGLFIIIGIIWDTVRVRQKVKNRQKLKVQTSYKKKFFSQKTKNENEINANNEVIGKSDELDNMDIHDFHDINETDSEEERELFHHELLDNHPNQRRLIIDDAVLAEEALLQDPTTDNKNLNIRGDRRYQNKNYQNNQNIRNVKSVRDIRTQAATNHSSKNFKEDQIIIIKRNNKETAQIHSNPMQAKQIDNKIENNKSKPMNKGLHLAKSSYHQNNIKENPVKTNTYPLRTVKAGGLLKSDKGFSANKQDLFHKQDLFQNELMDDIKVVGNISENYDAIDNDHLHHGINITSDLDPIVAERDLFNSVGDKNQADHFQDLNPEHGDQDLRAIKQDERGLQNSQPIILHVMANKGSVFKGQDLLHTFLESDLYYGEMQLFHHHENADGTGDIVFSAVSAVEPGFFDLSKMSRMTTPGISLFFMPCHPSQSAAAFELMLTVARRIADKMDGEIWDDERKILSVKAIDRYREKVRCAVV